MKNRKSIQVTPYALAEVIEALANDPEHFADIVVTKEDGRLIVMFNSTIEECTCLNELIDKVSPKEDKHDYPHDYPMRGYPIPKHGDPVLCDINVTSTSKNNNTNVITSQSCETLY